jgi:hypothetical protein
MIVSHSAAFVAAGIELGCSEAGQMALGLPLKDQLVRPDASEVRHCATAPATPVAERFVGCDLLTRTHELALSKRAWNIGFP